MRAPRCEGTHGMIIVMRMGAQQSEIDDVVGRISDLGFRSHLSSGDERVIIGVIGNDRPIAAENFLSLKGVEKVVPILQPYKLASRDFSAENSIIKITDDLSIGGDAVAIMAGPCSVESREQTMEIADELAACGVRIMRGGAFKPRTSPYSFQGLGEEALKILAEVREKHGMAIITEVMGPEELDMIVSYVDILQLGTRNMQNYRLLEACGKVDKPVLLKRGMSSTIEELLLAAEYILSHGNERVLLCERGIRTYERATRSTFDINAVPVLQTLSHLPVIVDPSHATGYWHLVGAVSKGAVAAGADGLIIEVHNHPEDAMSDGGQSLRPDTFAKLVGELDRVAHAVDRTLDMDPAVQRG